MTESADFLLGIEDSRALDWAAARSKQTLRFVDKTFRDQALAMLDSPQSVPYVRRRGDFYYNTWRSAQYPKGVWRRIPVAEFLADPSHTNPAWHVLIDVAKLAETEGENWVWKGAQALPGDYSRALIHLSRGGADAVVVREFDVDAAEFLPQFDSPFYLPEAKSQVSWVDVDTLLVCTDTGQGSLTRSGYPARVLLLKRGQELADAKEFFSGHTDDLLVHAWADHHEKGRPKIFVRRALEFYRSQTFLATDQGLQILALPEDCEVAPHGKWLFIFPREEFCGIPAGGLGAIELDVFCAGSRDFRLVYAPAPGASLQDIAVTKSRLIVTTLEDVSSSILTVPLAELGGELEAIELPSFVTASVVDAWDRGEEAWISTSSFLTPPTLYRLDSGTTPDLVVQAPALFDASGMETRQHWARSADGTEIPYFVTGRFDSLPRRALVHAYGGFEVSLVPNYQPTRGLWLSAGYLHVQANLRGGGEFGPAWHSSVIKEKRYKIYEDYQAVLRDLVARGYTTEKQILVRGGSNGGLLTAVALTQFPELIGAAAIQVPLTDMMRYHRWSAGASWMAEYGDPEGAEREALASYSPLHHVAGAPGAGYESLGVDGGRRQAQETLYPPALVSTSTRDDRVHPAHARLFAYELGQAGQQVDYFENSEGGHAGASDNEQQARLEALLFGWANHALG